MKNGVEQNWHATACILCSINCGIEIELDGRQFKRIRGDKNHPVSEGYLCQKAARLNYYQHHASRVKQPMRRKADGSFETIDWDTAIAEIAEKLTHLRDTYGGHSIAYYGGGGQGNHLPGAYASAFRAALKTPYIYNSLAQEKTGDFWVNGKLFGRQTCHVTEGIEHADYVILLGTNPWQSHGFPQARQVLKQIAKDPNRTLVVVDPRRTRTAEMADIHIPVKPGSDAFLLMALLGVIAQEGLADTAFLEKHTSGHEALFEILKSVSISNYAERAGVDVALVEKVARGLAAAKRGCTRHDLGLEQSLHSTLNCYLEKLLFLITGNFGKEGCNNLHTQFVALIGHSKEPEDGGVRTRVTGMKEISKLFPPNILPAEIDTDHPERVRAVFVDSANPMQTAADTQAYRKAFDKLDLLVVVDVAMSETAALADYILPASTQFEKAEATFFTLSFPTNYFHFRDAIIEREGDTLPEPEIYQLLVNAMGLLPKRFPLLETAAKMQRRYPKLDLFPKALGLTLALRPRWKNYAAAILYKTLGKVLPEGKQSAAVLWATARFYANRYTKQVRRAGYSGKKHLLGEALFNNIITAGTAVPLSTHTYEEVWELVRHKDGKIHLDIAEMFAEMKALQSESTPLTEAFPLILAAGERRSYNANQIYRDPDWRRNDKEGALRIHPTDGEKAGLSDGILARCESKTGAIEVRVQFDESMLPGYVSLPHGYGQQYPDADNPDTILQNGPSINLLTTGDHCDPIAKTPYHKFVPVRVQAI